MRAIAFLLSILATGCATTNRGKTIGLMLAGGSAGALYGQSRPEYQAQNSVMYGALGAAIAAIAGLYIFDEEKRAEDYRKQVLELQLRLDGGYSGANLSAQTSSLV